MGIVVVLLLLLAAVACPYSTAAAITLPGACTLRTMCTAVYTA
jgi:hypothetical protein